MPDIFDQIGTGPARPQTGDIFDQVDSRALLSNTTNSSAPQRRRHDTLGGGPTGQPIRTTATPAGVTARRPDPMNPSKDDIMGALLHPAAQIATGVGRISTAPPPKPKEILGTAIGGPLGMLATADPERLGGISDIARGTAELSIPRAAGPMFNALRATPVRALRAAGMGLAAQAGTESGLEAVGVAPGRAQILGDVAGLAAGGLGSQRWRGPAQEINPEAGLMRFHQIGPKDAGAEESLRRAWPEILKTAPELADPKFHKKWNKAEGEFVRYAGEKAAQTKDQLWQEWERMAAPARQSAKLDGNQLAAAIERAAPAADPIRGPRSAYTENLLAQFRGRPVPFSEAESILRDINLFTNQVYKGTTAQQQVKIAQDVNDMGALVQLGRELRAQLYPLADSANGGIAARELMNRWGAVDDEAQRLALMQNPAIMSMTPSQAALAMKAGVAAAQAGVGLKGSAVHTATGAVKGILGMNPTVDRALMKTLAEYAGRRQWTPLPTRPGEVTAPAPSGPSRLTTDQIDRLMLSPGPAKSAAESAEVLGPVAPKSYPPVGPAKSAAESASVFASGPNLSLPQPLAQKSAAESAAVLGGVIDPTKPAGPSAQTLMLSPRAILREGPGYQPYAPPPQSPQSLQGALTPPARTPVPAAGSAQTLAKIPGPVTPAPVAARSLAGAPPAPGGRLSFNDVQRLMQPGETYVQAERRLIEMGYQVEPLTMGRPPQ